MSTSAKLRLYAVFRHGNDFEEIGADGDDTIFIVRAKDHVSAAYLADQVVRYMPHERVMNWCQGVYELGLSNPVRPPGIEAEGVLFGPSYHRAANDGCYPEWRRWEEEEPWIFQGPCPKCGADFGPVDQETGCPECGHIGADG